MAGLLDQLVQEFAAPVLNEHGYVPQSNREFSRSAPNGDLAFAAFAPVRGAAIRPAEVFQIKESILPTTKISYTKYLYADSGNPWIGPRASQGLYQRAVRPPLEFDVYRGERISEVSWQWVLHPTEKLVSDAGPLLQSILKDDVLPRLDRLSDRGALLDELRSGVARAVTGLRVGEILLIVDDGESAELDALIAADLANSRGGESAIADWTALRLGGSD